MKPVIDRVDDHITKKQFRLPDGTLGRQRPWPVSVWIDDAYMSIPFLAAMGKLTGETRYFDDAARQVIGMSARLFHEDTGLFDHTWFEHAAPYDPVFYWGRGAGWMLMSMAELLSVMPEDHPDRAKVLELYRRGVQGAVRVQGSIGLLAPAARQDRQLSRDLGDGDVHLRDRARREPRLDPGGLRPGRADGLARRRARACGPTGNIDGICVEHDRRGRRRLLLQPADRTSPRCRGTGPCSWPAPRSCRWSRTFDISRTNNTFYYRTKK